MKIALIIGGILIALFTVLLVLGCCKVASQADATHERLMIEAMKESKEKPPVS